MWAPSPARFPLLLPLPTGRVPPSFRPTGRGSVSRLMLEKGREVPLGDSQGRQVGGVGRHLLGTWGHPPTVAGWGWLRMGRVGPLPSETHQSPLAGAGRHLLETWGHHPAVTAWGWLRMGRIGPPPSETHQGRQFGGVGRHFLETWGRLQAGSELGREGLSHPPSAEAQPWFHWARHGAGCGGVPRRCPCPGPRTDLSPRRQRVRSGWHH